ncbi:MAG: hypothetical protein ABI240_08705 [Sphingomonas sp.]
MKVANLAIAAALMCITTAAPAQTAPAPVDPVAAANQDAAAQIAVRQETQNAARADAVAATQAQYDADMVSYRAALRAHHRAVVADVRIADHQQRAYADAMAAWREQVYACKHGDNRACEAPAPDPAAFW